MNLANELPFDGSDQLLSDTFDGRTLLDMEVALDRACSGLPLESRSHESRTFIAAKIIERVQAGAATQDAMMRATLDTVEALKNIPAKWRCASAHRHCPFNRCYALIEARCQNSSVDRP